MHENHILDGFVTWLETLTIHGVHRLAPFVAADVRCRNLLGEALGPRAAGALYGQLFEGVAQIKSKILDRAPGSDGHTTYLRWDRLITMNTGHFHTLSGITEVMIGHDGKIVSIIEYWDEAPQTRKSFWARLLRR